MGVTSLLAVILGLLALAANAQDKHIESLAPYYATPELVVDRMLKLADLKPGERMFDLGSGDGRIVIMAARKYRADATGVEFDGSLFKQSMQRIKADRPDVYDWLLPRGPLRTPASVSSRMLSRVLKYWRDRRVRACEAKCQRY